MPKSFAIQQKTEKIQSITWGKLEIAFWPGASYDCLTFMGVVFARSKLDEICCHKRHCTVFFGSGGISSKTQLPTKQLDISLAITGWLCLSKCKSLPEQSTRRQWQADVTGIHIKKSETHRNTTMHTTLSLPHCALFCSANSNIQRSNASHSGAKLRIACQFCQRDAKVVEINTTILLGAIDKGNIFPKSKTLRWWKRWIAFTKDSDSSFSQQTTYRRFQS